MRGGPRMMCSPYLTGSLVVMLVIVSFNYWTTQTENSDLAKRIQDLQQQLKTGSSYISSLESEKDDLQRKLKQFKTNEIRSKELEDKKYKEVLEGKEKLEKKLTDMKAIQAEDEEEEKRLNEEKESQEKMVDSLRDELESVKRNLSSCQGELASERADRLLVPPAGGEREAWPPRHLDTVLGPGQLPDINPEAVSVVRKETQGMTFHKDKSGHWLPIIPAGDPNSPRAQPKFSVMDLKPGQFRAKKDTLVGSGLKLEPLPPPLGSHGPESQKLKAGNISSSSKPPGVLPLSEQFKLPGDNLDQAEDDSQIAQHENGPEGKEEIQDDDQNPDGQIDETVDLDKQLYLVDKNQVEDDKINETLNGDEESPGELGTSNEDVGEEKLENLKESLNKEDETPLTR